MSEVTVKQWITELRYGGRSQITGGLHGSCGGFCCLGVAIDMAGTDWHSSEEPDGWLLTSADVGDMPTPDELADMGELGRFLSWTLDREIVENLTCNGIPLRGFLYLQDLYSGSEVGNLVGGTNRVVTLAARLNDAGLTFAQIADVMWNLYSIFLFKFAEVSAC